MCPSFPAKRSKKTTKQRPLRPSERRRPELATPCCSKHRAVAVARACEPFTTLLILTKPQLAPDGKPWRPLVTVVSTLNAFSRGQNTSKSKSLQIRTVVQFTLVSANAASSDGIRRCLRKPPARRWSLAFAKRWGKPLWLRLKPLIMLERVPWNFCWHHLVNSFSLR